MHSDLDMRVVARMSSAEAGGFPILREEARKTTMRSMSGLTKINVSALKRDIISHTGAGKPFSRRSLSLQATGSKNPDLVRDILTRGRDKQLTVETVAGLAEAMGIPLSTYVSSIPPPSGKTRIPVVGVVQAGAWNERPEWPEQDRYEIEVEPASLPGERFALEMVGHSMDRIIPPGSILECIRVFGNDGPTPTSGDIVIVRRQKNELAETTCKRLEITEEGVRILHCDSYRPEFANPIYMGPEGDGLHSDDEIQIIALVDRATRSFIKRRG